MRIYSNFREALDEIKRDLAEMGVMIHSETYQNKQINGDSDFEAKEITNYMYCVNGPNTADLEPVQPWADLEFKERISNQNINPGRAYKYRKEIWEQFLNKEGKFDYSYPERLTKDNKINSIIKRISLDPGSRQLFISIWGSEDINYIGGKARVPCSLGYYFKISQGALDITYLQRSADFAIHFVNDIYLAAKLQKFIAEKTRLPVGNFYHWVGSLHIFKKDIKEVF